MLDNVIVRYYIVLMKRREITPEISTNEGLEALAKALSVLSSATDVRAFLQDLCTPAEMEALVDRWQVVPYLLEEMPYREIHDHTGVSVTTIGRVSRTLNQGAGGYRKAAERVGLIKK
jgi:TrpR-related protein YerC/YecD